MLYIDLKNRKGLAWMWYSPLSYLIWRLFEIMIKANKDTKAICVLGTRGSGKTTLFKRITNEYYVGSDGTTWDTVNEVEVAIGSRRLKLKETIDIGGGNDYVREYEKLIEDKDFVFITFNLSEMMNSEKEVNKENVLEFQSRLLAISKLIKGKNYQVIGSHLDKINVSEKEYKKRRQEYFELIGRKYFEMLPEFSIEKHFIMLDLKDKKLMRRHLDAVFSELIK